MPTTGDRIREVREKRKMTQDQVAEATGLSKGFISDVEHNNRNISSQNLLKVANALGASVEYLLRGETKQPGAKEPVVIPSELSKAAEQLELTYAETLELLEAHNSIVARRSNRSLKDFTVDDWTKLHRAIKGVFG